MSWHSSADGVQSANSTASSRARFIGLIGTGTAPSFHAATSPMTKPGTFWRTSATRSPGVTPRGRRNAANRSLAASSAA